MYVCACNLRSTNLVHGLFFVFYGQPKLSATASMSSTRILLSSFMSALGSHSRIPGSVPNAVAAARTSSARTLMSRVTSSLIVT